MKLQQVKVHPSKADLKREDQLAWKIAEVAADPVPVEKEVAAMIVNRIIDNAAVAIAAINRRPVVSARDMALGHPRRDGATVFGVQPAKRVSPGMGRLGERRRGARARLPRHVPGRRLLPSGRQHSAHSRGGADDGAVGARPDPRASRRATRSRSTWCARSACTSTRSTTSPISVPPRRPASARCCACRRRSSIRRCSRRCTSAPPRGSRARARSPAGRPMRPRPPARSRSKRSTAPCAARAHRARSTKARTA